MEKENVVHVHNEILFGHKNNKILSFVTTWVNLENTVLSEISQAEKSKY